MSVADATECRAAFLWFQNESSVVPKDIGTYCKSEAVTGIYLAQGWRIELRRPFIYLHLWRYACPDCLIVTELSR
jgi:hypothetical protein